MTASSSSPFECYQHGSLVNINCKQYVSFLQNFQVPFLDPTNTLLYPILPLIAADYDEFGYPEHVDDFSAIREYSPYDNIPKDVPFPAVLVTSSFNTRLAISSYKLLGSPLLHLFLVLFCL